MSLLEKLCKELGVNIKEVWIGNDGLHYCISPLGGLYSVEYKDNLEEDVIYRPDDISRVLSEDLKPVWKPKDGEKYFIPFLGYNSLEKLYDSWNWMEGSKVSEWHREKGLICRTKEEAIEMSEKILDFIKEKNSEEGC